VQQECHPLHHEVLRYVPHIIYDPYSFVYPCRCSVLTMINVGCKSSTWHILDQKFAYICKVFRKKHTCCFALSQRNSEYTSWNTLRSIILSYVRCKIRGANEMSANDSTQVPTVKQDLPQSWYRFSTSERQ